MSTDDAFLLVTCELMMLDVNHGNALARAIFADQVKQHAGRLLAAASSPTSAFLPSEPNARIFLRAALTLYLHTLQMGTASELISHSPELRQSILQVCANVPQEESATERVAKITSLVNKNVVSRGDATTVLRLLKELVAIYLEASKQAQGDLFEELKRITEKAAQHSRIEDTRDISASPDPTQMLPPDPVPTLRRPSDAAQRRSAAATPARTPLEQSPAMVDPILEVTAGPGTKRAIGTVVLQQPKPTQPSAETRPTVRIGTGRKVHVAPEDDLTATPNRALNVSNNTPAVPHRATSAPRPVAQAPTPPVLRRYTLCGSCGVYHAAEVYAVFGCSALTSSGASSK